MKLQKRNVSLLFLILLIKLQLCIKTGEICLYEKLKKASKKKKKKKKKGA